MSNDETIDALMDNLENETQGEEKGIFKRFKNKINKLSGTSRSGVQIANAMKSLSRAIVYAKQAKNICVAIDDGHKNPEQFLEARELCNRGIAVLDDAMTAFPQTLSALSPLRTKLVDQKMQIEQVMRDEYGIMA